MAKVALHKRFKNIHFLNLCCMVLAGFVGNGIKTPCIFGSGSGVMPVVFVTFCSLLLPDNAWALQSHGAPEGLYVHQMAHIHFILALGYLYWDIRRSSFAGKGWRYLLTFCVLMLGWNIVAFVGHAVAVYIDADTIMSAGGYLRDGIQGPYDFQKLIFYFAKFDHLLAVPALFFFYMGMRSLYRSVEKHAGEVGK